MRVIKATDLVVGTKLGSECYTPEGELLITGGVAITQALLDAMTRRNIFEVYIRENESQDEIEQILALEIKDLGKLDIEEDPIAVDPESSTADAHKIIQLPELKDIKKGRDGLTQLMTSKKVTDLDTLIEKGFVSDKPAGPPFAQSMTQISCRERTAEYKDGVALSYASALNEVKQLLNSLTVTGNLQGNTISAVVDRFIRTFITDKNILLAISNTKHTGNDYLYNHSLNVCLMSLNIAAASNYSEKQILEIGICALLHDIGMLMISPEIRIKSGKLSEDEWFEVQKHPILGLHLLERITRLPTMVPMVVYQSHERENGKGYPRQRSGRLIHNYSKIIQLADVFEALCSPRPHRPALAPYTGMENLVKMARQGLVNPDFTKAFLTYTSLFPVGSIVELSDHTIAKVVAANGSSFTKPIVSVLMDERKRLLDDNEIYQINLKETTDIQIIQSFRHDYLEEAGALKGF